MHFNSVLESQRAFDCGTSDRILVIRTSLQCFIPGRSMPLDREPCSDDRKLLFAWNQQPPLGGDNVTSQLSATSPLCLPGSSATGVAAVAAAAADSTIT
jgi:hypothetical protein